MLKAELKSIKNDLWEVLGNKKYVQSAIKQMKREIEAERKAELARYATITSDAWTLAYWKRQDDERYGRLLRERTDYIISQYHCDQSYHLIYKDGSEACVTAEEILSGEPFPKVSNIVYAELSSGYENYDTETGDLDFYSEEAMEACDGNYEAEDERRWQYDAAIEIKYGTEWGKRWTREHPDFVPVAL